MDLQGRFEIAVKESKELASKPNNEMLLKLYSLYKQATEGDISPNTPAPGMFDFVNKAKQECLAATQRNVIRSLYGRIYQNHRSIKNSLKHNY